MNPVWVRRLGDPCKDPEFSQNSNLVTVRYIGDTLNVRDNFAFEAGCMD